MSSNALSGRAIALGVTGGIAAYKAVDLLRRLVEAGARVRVVMTEAATAFVGPLTFEALSQAPVVTDVLGLGAGGGRGLRIEHVALADEVDAVVVAPATADFLARAAGGRADDALGALLLSTRAPLLVAPAMEHKMWRHPATQANVAILEQRGVHWVGPGEGALASGAVGQGRLAEVDEIVEALGDLLASGRDLAGRRILVTSGPTREAVDPVRYISNRSSGRMGFAVAQAAAQRGAQVTLVHGPCAVPAPAVDTVVAVESAAEMHRETVAAAAQADVVIMAAAVADYAAASVAERKLSKGEQPLHHIDLVPTRDILAELCTSKAGRLIVGFAAETHDVVSRAQAKLARKGADLIVANLVGTEDSGFDVSTNRATLVFADGRAQDLGLLSKEQVAERLLDAIVELLR
jgi:phosphopantothenoylcysteine decarboxylase/phosphopantothenate--cysteine ligase